MMRMDVIIQNMMGKNKKIKKVMLINPPQLAPVDGMKRIMPPVGLLYVGAGLKKGGYDVDVLDSPMEGYQNERNSGDGYLLYGLDNKQTLKRIENSKPDVIGISLSFSSRYNNTKKLIQIIRNKVNVPIIVGGLHANLIANELVQSHLADYVILGEGEFRTRNLLDAIQKTQIPNMDGVVYFDSGQVISTGIPKPILNLDKIPFPDRELIDIENYFDIGLPFNPFSRSERAIQILGSRGCPMNCSFCSTKNFWGGYRSRSVENILTEIQESIEKYGVREVQFIDDNLTINRERSKSLFSKLEEYHLNWCTPNGVMVQTLDEEMIKLMAKSGAYQMSFAIESGSERVRRDLIGKFVPPKEKVKKLVDIARDNGVQVHGLFVLGFPGETKEEIEASLRYPAEVGFGSVSFFNLSPLPGSRIFEECLKKGYIDSRKAQPNNFRSPEIKIPQTSPDYFGFTPQELVTRIEEETQRFHENSKKKYPEEWERKFANYKKIHSDLKLVDSLY